MSGQWLELARVVSGVGSRVGGWAGVGSGPTFPSDSSHLRSPLGQLNLTYRHPTNKVKETSKL